VIKFYSRFWNSSNETSNEKMNEQGVTHTLEINFYICHMCFIFILGCVNFDNTKRMVMSKSIWRFDKNWIFEPLTKGRKYLWIKINIDLLIYFGWDNFYLRALTQEKLIPMKMTYILRVAKDIWILWFSAFRRLWIDFHSTLEIISKIFFLISAHTKI
jgi:hypothetical protein